MTQRACYTTRYFSFRVTRWQWRLSSPSSARLDIETMRDQWAGPWRLNEHVWHGTYSSESPPCSNRLGIWPPPNALIARGFDFILLSAQRFSSPTMVEHSGLDSQCLNKYCHSSSSSSSSEHDKKMFAKLKLSLSGDYPRKNGEILSGQYGTNLLLLGVAMMLAIQGEPAVREEHLLAFVTCLMILQLIWMLWYMLVRDRQKNTRTEKDVHATTCWIRGEFVRLRARLQQCMRKIASWCYVFPCVLEMTEAKILIFTKTKGLY